LAQSAASLTALYFISSLPHPDRHHRRIDVRPCPAPAGIAPCAAPVPRRIAPPPSVSAFVPLRVGVSRFVRVPIGLCLQQKETQMTSMDLDGWTRVKDRLRAEVGDDVYASWFARMELDGSEGDTVKLSVPTRFLKSWIQSHYAERVLACWQAEQPNFSRI